VNGELDDRLLDPTGSSSAGGTSSNLTGSQPGRFADVHSFVADYLAEARGRPVRDTDPTFRWRARWLEHRTVVDRLTDLWQAHEALHDEGATGAARWWRDHADPGLQALTHPKGPFAHCGPDRHQLPPRLPLADRPQKADVP